MNNLKNFTILTFIIFKKPRFWFSFIFLFKGSFFFSSYQSVFSLKQVKKSLILLVITIISLLEWFRHENQLWCTSSLARWMLSDLIEDFFSVSLSLDGCINDFVTKILSKFTFHHFQESFYSSKLLLDREKHFDNLQQQRDIRTWCTRTMENISRWIFTSCIERHLMGLAQAWHKEEISRELLKIRSQLNLSF